MKTQRRFSASVSTEAYGLIVIGGESNSKERLSSVEYLRDETWEELIGVQLQISRHCAVFMNGIGIYVIGGHFENQPFSGKVFLLDLRESKARPVKDTLMKNGRQFHSCANMGKDRIIVAGGRNHLGFLKSVEVLNLRTLKWTEPKHLQLNIGISHAQLIPGLTGLCSK